VLLYRSRSHGGILRFMRAPSESSVLIAFVSLITLAFGLFLVSQLAPLFQTISRALAGF
jgi:hypothetical protein